MRALACSRSSNPDAEPDDIARCCGDPWGDAEGFMESIRNHCKSVDSLTNSTRYEQTECVYGTFVGTNTHVDDATRRRVSNSVHGRGQRYATEGDSVQARVSRAHWWLTFVGTNTHVDDATRSDVPSEGSAASKRREKRSVR